MHENLKYPIGKYIVQPFSNTLFAEWLIDIKNLPQHLENAVLNLDEVQLDTAYREDGWTIKQVVHHVADSHMNAYIRFKLGLTEDNPTIKPYDEAAWALLSDTKNLPINISLTLLHSLHIRFYELLKNMTVDDMDRTIFHPDHKKQFTLWELLGMYAWHGKHHTAHITSLRERMNW
ncbi:MAG TPA: putative metal-dependent hydrolase [Ferruginibacter sp.]|nr:putative metal-dependent hydrolase [Ferruginibacter sp.]